MRRWFAPGGDSFQPAGGEDDAREVGLHPSAEIDERHGAASGGETADLTSACLFPVLLFRAVDIGDYP